MAGSRRQWNFLAIFNGYNGTDLAEYAARNLPARICAALNELLGTPLEADATTETQRISDMLSHRIQRFDRDLGKAVRNLSENPDELDDAAAQAIVDANFDILARAHYGSTFAAALVNEDGTKLWVASLGILSMSYPISSRMELAMVRDYQRGTIPWCPLSTRE
ncbi:hypothetical protein B0H17DRAFT_81596 [Mycena rosella]|uniref:Uncharacterized protein n=1 Tax=Mycena rosella TaxID=1033263 RepID=A0AAD7GQB7_MYCRO|nr:hypothetical protein B0H17DRAFT_81596 [Mycena rosella]